jgi:hypothetical protein
MPKAIPSKVLKMSKPKQLEWVANEIKMEEQYCEELRRFSRSLVLDSHFTPRVDIRPDENKDE